MDFLTQQNLVSVPAERVRTTKTILPCNQILARTSLSLLGKLNAAADFTLLGRLHLRPLQMFLLSVWRPHILPLNHQIMISSMIRFHLKWWMDTNRFVTGIPIHPLEPNVFLFMDASHCGWGAYIADETILSRSLEGRPIPAPYQYARNDGHLFCTNRSHNIYSPFLCHDIYGQHNSGLLYQQTRQNSLSQPMYRGLEDPQLVSGTRYHCQSSHIFQANSMFWQTTSPVWTNLSKQNGHWIK